jgi:serine/threonine-protein kinase
MPASPDQVKPGFPVALKDIIWKCLEKKPENRYATALEVRDALVGFLKQAPSIVAPTDLGEFVRELMQAEAASAANQVPLPEEVVIASGGAAIEAEGTLKAKIGALLNRARPKK